MPIGQIPVGDLSERSYITATRIVNEIPPALSFLDPLLFGDGIAEQSVLTTEDFEIVTVSDDKTMAPFIQPGTRPPAAQGIGYTVKHVSTPMLADARNFPVAEMLLRRRPGVSHYASAQATAAGQAHMVEEFSKLTRRLDNRQEWMAAQLLDRSLSYSNAGTSGAEGQGTAAFDINYGADPKTELTLSVGWDDLQFTSTSTSDNVGGLLRDSSVYQSHPSWCFQLAGRVMNELVRVTPTHCIMGVEAAAAFMTHPGVRAELDTTNYEVGALQQLANSMDVNGARYLGRYQGVQCWEYAGQLQGETDGSASSFLVAAGKVYFIHVGPQAEFQRVHGLIPNWKLSFGSQGPTSMDQMSRLRAVAARRFADVVVDDYGNSMEGLIYARPLPVLRRPNVIVSAQVVTSSFGTTSEATGDTVVPGSFGYTDGGAQTLNIGDII